MLTFTDAARDMVRAFMAGQDEPDSALRIHVLGSPFAPEYEFTLVDSAPDPEDVVVRPDGLQVFLDRGSAELLEGATVDYVERNGESGFEVRPVARPVPVESAQGELTERVRHAIDEGINPAIAAHGGRITLVGVHENIVYLEMSGGCQGCGMAQVTLRQGVERMIKQAVPEIMGIRDVTDHASGRNPYFQAAH